MKYKITCPQCKHHCYVRLSEPGDIKCKCPTCDAVFPVHVSRASFAEAAADSSSSRHTAYSSLSSRQLNRRLAAFFIGSAAFIGSVVIGLYVCAIIFRHMIITP